MEYLSMSEAARRSHLSTKTLQRAIRAGELHEAPRQQENQARIATDELERFLAARAGVQVAPTSVNTSGLETRLAELEQTIASMQEGYHNDQLLGAGRDLLALGPADDAYTQGRIDTLESRIAEQKQTTDHLQRDFVSDQSYTHTRLDHYGQQITDTTIYISKLEQTIIRMQEQVDLDHKLAYGRIDVLEKRINELTVALQDTQDLVIKLSSQISGQQKTVFPVEIHEFAEKHGIPWSGISQSALFALRPIEIHGEDCLDEKGQATFWRLFHDRSTWTPCPDCPHGNLPSAQPAQKETSVPAPVQPADETTFELADFTQLLQTIYRSSATRGDVKAWLNLRPEPLGVPGDYHIDFFESGRADGKRAKLKGEQVSRGEQLKQDLRVRVVQALYEAGWQGGPHGIYASPKPVQS